jgi:hypothetical protein
MISFFLLLLGKWKSSLGLFLLIASYPSLLKVDQLLGSGLLKRVVNHDLLNDSRFIMLRFWLDNLTTDPFKRPEVGPTPWDYLQWFHNFFADVHRLSGFWALMAAVFLVIYIFFRIAWLVKKDKRLGLFLMSMAMCCFLIMNTSVVPEGERQPFLLLLAIGAISEVALARLAKEKRCPAPSHLKPE